MVINIDCPKEYSEREARLLRKVTLQEYEIACNAIRLERITNIVSELAQFVAKANGSTVRAIPTNKDLIDDNAEYNALKRVTQEIESSFPGVRVDLAHDS
jgi:hypothetical protein